jgi:RNA polymerase sigma-70 factor, ECF subfamily
VAEAREAALPAPSAAASAAPSRGRAAGARSLASSGERALVRAAQGGSAEAMEELFRRHWPRAHRAAWLVVHDAAAAEDVAQEAFLAAVRALDRFDRRRPFGPWLHRIVVNRAIDHARARAVRREVPADAVAEAFAAVGSGEGPSGEVLAALACLAPEHRAVIVLRHLLEFTPGEIAKVLGLPRGTVNSRLRRGLDALAEPLRDEVLAGGAGGAGGARRSEGDRS